MKSEVSCMILSLALVGAFSGCGKPRTTQANPESAPPASRPDQAASPAIEGVVSDSNGLRPQIFVGTKEVPTLPAQPYIFGTPDQSHADRDPLTIPPGGRTTHEGDQWIFDDVVPWPTEVVGTEQEGAGKSVLAPLFLVFEGEEKESGVWQSVTARHEGIDAFNRRVTLDEKIDLIWNAESGLWYLPLVRLFADQLPENANPHLTHELTLIFRDGSTTPVTQRVRFRVRGPFPLIRHSLNIHNEPFRGTPVEFSTQVHRQGHRMATEIFENPYDRELEVTLNMKHLSALGVQRMVAQFFRAPTGGYYPSVWDSRYELDTVALTLTDGSGQPKSETRPKEVFNSQGGWVEKLALPPRSTVILDWRMLASSQVRRMQTSRWNFRYDWVEQVEVVRWRNVGHGGDAPFRVREPRKRSRIEPVVEQVWSSLVSAIVEGDFQVAELGFEKDPWAPPSAHFRGEPTVRVGDFNLDHQDRRDHGQGIVLQGS